MFTYVSAGFLLNQVSKMRLSETPSNGHDVRKTAENELYKGLQTIRQSSLEIREILSILKPLLVSEWEGLSVCMCV